MGSLTRDDVDVDAGRPGRRGDGAVAGQGGAEEVTASDTDFEGTPRDIDREISASMESACSSREPESVACVPSPGPEVAPVSAGPSLCSGISFAGC